MLRLFGSGAEILEAGRQRRSILRINAYEAPISGVLRLVGGWEFTFYQFDCNADPLTEQDLTDLAHGAIVKCAAPDHAAERFEELRVLYARHPAVSLAEGQICDYACEFENADRHFAKAQEQAPHSQAVRAATDQRHKHEQLLDELQRFPEILIHDNPGLGRSLLKRGMVLQQQNRPKEARAILMLVGRFDPEVAALVANMDSVQSITHQLLKAAGQQGKTPMPGE
jgi:tetratricopeptide (TPR) repeat protein